MALFLHPSNGQSEGVTPKRVRFSILGLMGGVIAVALVLAAWANASELWSNVVFNLTLLVLLTATWKARWERGSGSAWWFGFAIFGWAHLILVLPSGHSFTRGFELVTVTVVRYVLDWLGPEILGPFDPVIGPALVRYYILMDVLSLGVAVVGGWIAVFLASRQGLVTEEERELG